MDYYRDSLADCLRVFLSWCRTWPLPLPCQGAKNPIPLGTFHQPKYSLYSRGLSPACPQQYGVWYLYSPSAYRHGTDYFLFGFGYRYKENTYFPLPFLSDDSFWCFLSQYCPPISGLSYANECYCHRYFSTYLLSNPL